jgi:hypothetical protein
MRASDGLGREDGDSNFLLQSMDRDGEDEESDNLDVGESEVQLGTLPGEQDSGGLGKHLGLYSTTLLM